MHKFIDTAAVLSNNLICAIKFVLQLNNHIFVYNHLLRRTLFDQAPRFSQLFPLLLLFLVPNQFLLCIKFRVLYVALLTYRWSFFLLSEIAVFCCKVAEAETTNCLLTMTLKPLICLSRAKLNLRLGRWQWDTRA